MKKYYRTYITHFETPNGYRVYAGKHESTFKDPKTDPYYGSGIYPVNAVSKYGKGCIKKIEWFDHDLSNIACKRERRIELGRIERDLIKSVMSKYGKGVCQNIAGGGEGNVWAYANDEMRERHRENTRDAFYRHFNSPEQIKLREEKQIQKEKDRQAKIEQLKAEREIKRKQILDEKARIKEEKIRIRKEIAEAKRRIKLEEREAKRQSKSESTKLRGVKISIGHRKRKRVWQYYDELKSLWLENGKPKYVKFHNIAVSNGYPDDSYVSIVTSFQKDINEYVEKEYTNEPNWYYKDELYEIWIHHNKPENVRFNKVVVEYDYPTANYTEMIQSFKSSNLSNLY